MEVLYTILTLLICYILFFLGCYYGSFAIAKTQRKLTEKPASLICEECGYCWKDISIEGLAPFVTYIQYQGRCPLNGSDMSRKIVIEEAVCGFVFLSLFLRYKFSLIGLEYLLLFMILLAASIVDIEARIIPNFLIIAAVIIKAIFILLSGNIIGEFFFSIAGGLIVGFVLLLTISIFKSITKKDGMGGGDVKLFIVTGLFLGLEKNIICVTASTIIALLFIVYKWLLDKYENIKIKEDDSIQFAPFITFGCWITVMLF